MSIDCDSIMDHRKMFPVVGGAVIAILAGMIIAMFWNDKNLPKQGLNGLLK